MMFFLYVSISAHNSPLGLQRKRIHSICFYLVSYLYTFLKTTKAYTIL